MYVFVIKDSIDTTINALNPIWPPYFKMAAIYSFEHRFVSSAYNGCILYVCFSGSSTT